jgi:hypothetical protein
MPELKATPLGGRLAGLIRREASENDDLRQIYIDTTWTPNPVTRYMLAFVFIFEPLPEEVQEQLVEYIIVALPLIVGAGYAKYGFQEDYDNLETPVAQIISVVVSLFVFALIGSCFVSCYSCFERGRLRRSSKYAGARLSVSDAEAPSPGSAADGDSPPPAAPPAGARQPRNPARTPQAAAPQNTAQRQLAAQAAQGQRAAPQTTARQ